MVSPSIWRNFVNNQEGLETIWEAPDEFGNSLGLSSWRQTLRKSEAASGLTPDRCSTASFSACAAGANGTDCRKNWGTTAQSIAPFNGGWNWVSCAEYGEPWWNSAKSWAAWTVGRRQTGPWARHALIGPNPTDRGKAGSKRSLLVEGQGGPLSIVVAVAHDATLLDETLEAIVVERPQLTEDDPQHLCLDKGYDNGSSSRRQTRLSETPARRSWTVLGASGILRAGGLWNGL